MKLKALVPLIAGVLALPLAAQNQPPPLVTQSIDESSYITLRGSVHPLAQAGSDRGAVPDSFSAGRMLLLLNRPSDRQAALQQFLQSAHTHGSAGYHQWLTPEQFGQQFGPDDSDLATASGWLTSHGFNVAGFSKSREFIEFSGTAGALRSAFHTEIHEYAVNGATQYANATELQIPAALSALVKGVSPLNSYRAMPQSRVLGHAAYSRAKHQVIPQWTMPNGPGAFYAVAPEDFATQYDLAPLYQAGINGSGQTIGIINESNIDLTMVQAYQKLFGLSNGTPQLIVDGSDPGTLPNVSTEAYLDVEEAGAVAPGASVDLYIGNTSGLFTGSPTAGNETIVDPLYMAALRAVDDNQASVLSLSFGECEGYLLASGNLLWSELWQQAAAQGQTVLVSSGDSGSAGCDNANNENTTQYGLAVNGLASTPWDVAVGGTDFYYSDYATGGASIAGLWNQKNDTSFGSLKAPLPEQVWNTVYGLNATGPYQQTSGLPIPAGGGGISGCINSAESVTSGSAPFVCSANSAGLYGYEKPGWQSGTGVPSDGVRDLPDISLFAAAGDNFSAYPICAAPGDCVANSNGVDPVTLVGGTSASTAAMAAIMALVDQKYGRQGQADFTIYSLARRVPAAFHDVTLGGNNMPCVAGSPGCVLDTNGDGLSSLQKYAAGSGYDLASGLGSIDASVLVNNWNANTTLPTATTLGVSPTTAQRGSPVDVTMGVKSLSGGGSPQGSVTLVADLTSAPAQPVGEFPLSGGAAGGPLSNLPGGTYEVWAQYSGDGTFAPSQSAPQIMTIAPAGSALNLYGFQVYGLSMNPAAPCSIASNVPVYEQATSSGGVQSPYGPWPSGTTLGASWQVAPVAIANGIWPTLGAGSGNVTFTVDGAPQSTVALNSHGYAAWIPPSIFNAGTHTIGATYSGDASYNSSTATPYTVVVPQATPELFAFPAANCTGSSTAPTCAFSAGDNLRVEVQLSEPNCHVPAGALTVNLGSLTQNVTLSPGGLLTGGAALVSGIPVMSGEAVFQNLPAGSYPLSASFAGDTNFLATTTTATGQTGPSYTVVATAPPAPLLPTTATVSASPASMTNSVNLTVNFTATITGPGTSKIAPTGTVNIFDDGMEIGTGTLAPSGPNSATATAIASGYGIDIGSSQLRAVYSGDSVYQSSAAVPAIYQFNLPHTPDFLLASQIRQLSVQAGGSGTAGFNLAPIGGYSGTVNLTCTPSSSLITCSLNPSSVAVNGRVITTLTVNASAQTAPALARAQRQSLSRWPLAAGVFGFGLLFVRRLRKSMIWRSMLLSLILLAVLAVSSCGGGGSSSGGGGTGGGGTGGSGGPTTITPPNAYTVLVTASGSNSVHNASITVVVP
jgi:hypothetical protein